MAGHGKHDVWDIDRTGCPKTLETASKDAEDLQRAAAATATNVDTLVAALSNSGPVAARLAEFGAHHMAPTFSASLDRMVAAILQTATAYRHYRKGDRAMAENAIRAARTAPVPKPPAGAQSGGKGHR